MKKLLDVYDSITDHLSKGSNSLWPFLLRAILFYEFFFPGMGKLNGENWFSGINDKFPFPFNQLSAEVNWFVAGYGEVIFASLLLVGLFTRFAAVSLLVITGVAVAAVHWPESWSSLSQLWEGYGIKSGDAGNFKLPLLYTMMLIPLVFQGGGVFSLDKFLLKMSGRDSGEPKTVKANFYTYALVFAVPALSLFWVMPKTGLALLLIAAGMAAFQKLAQTNS